MRLTRIIFLSACLAGCAHAASKPADSPTDYAPLPPESATPIGMIVEHQADLGLTDDQVTTCKRADAKLNELNTPLLADLDAAERPHGGGGGGGGGGHGGRGHGGGGPRMTGAGASGGVRSRGQPPPSEEKPESKESAAQRQAAADQARTQINANTNAALSECLDPLDDPQVDKARTLLHAHGY